MHAFEDVMEYEVRVYCDDCVPEQDCLCTAVEQCVTELRLRAKVLYHTQMVDRVRAGIPLSPAFSINGNVLAMGRQLSKETIRALIKTAADGQRDIRTVSGGQL